MDTAWISAFSAIVGSSVGGFTSFITTYVTQRSQYRRDFLSKEFALRESLYSDFINEAARLQIESLDHQMEKVSTLVSIYALPNRIRLNASEEALRAAQRVIGRIIESYQRPNMTAEDIRATSQHDVEDPLKEFGEACRNGLRRLYRFVA